MKTNRRLQHLWLLGKHLGYIAVSGAILLMLFFYIILPLLTRHGEYIIVPVLEETTLEQASYILEQKHLCYVVQKDQRYNIDLPPGVVLDQHPKPHSYVKSHRKIYLTVNADSPPDVQMPSLIQGSVRNAQSILNCHGLSIGKINYVPDIARGIVLEQWYDGSPISAGATIKQGTHIDLVVGAGLGNQLTTVPEVLGMYLEDAKISLLDAGLRVGHVELDKSSDDYKGNGATLTILRQHPGVGSKIRLGETVDLWLGLWQDLEQNLEKNLEQNLEQNLEKDPEQNLEKDLEQNLEKDLEKNPEKDLEQDTEQDLEQNPEKDPEKDQENDKN